MPTSAPVQTPTAQKTHTTAQGSSAFFASAEATVLPVTPVRPSHTLSTSGALQRSFDSILARGLSSATTPTTSSRAQPIQRKTGAFPDPSALKAEESRFFPDEYDDVLTSVSNYSSDTITPKKNYGKQLLKLKQVRADIRKWEDRNGSVSAEAKTENQTERRRRLLTPVKLQLPVEDAAVRQQGFDWATNRHAKDTAKVFAAVGKAQHESDRRLKNSAAWIMSGRTRLYAVTPTGDSDARVEEAGMDPENAQAWFPEGVVGAPGHVLDPLSTYNKDDLGDNTGIYLDGNGKNTGGWNDIGLIAVAKGSKRSESDLFGVLRHEVQHDADKRHGRDALEGVHEAGEQFEMATTEAAATAAKHAFKAEYNLSRYKTEYRAYSYMGVGDAFKFDTYDNTRQSIVYKGYKFSERQFKIFGQIYGEYAHTRESWDGDDSLSDGSKFRKAVSEYWDPDTEGMNKYNSPRVDDFVNALDALDDLRAAGLLAVPNTLETEAGAGDIAPVGRAVSDVADAQVVALLNTINALTQEDADAIVNEQPALMSKIRKHLSGAALNEVLFRLHQKAPGPLVGEGMFA